MSFHPSRSPQSQPPIECAGKGVINALSPGYIPGLSLGSLFLPLALNISHIE